MGDAEPEQPDAWRSSMADELRAAIEADALIVEYQPKADLGRQEIVGVEALVRWAHPRYGTLPPDDFIPLAERSGLIRPLTELVLDRTLRQWRSWDDLGLSLSVAVNLSALSLLDDDLVDTVAAMLTRTEVPPAVVTLEMSDLGRLDRARAVGSMNRLAEIGIRLSISGFDGGQSTRLRLEKLPVHEVTIDKSFVLIMAVDGDAATIVRSVIDLASSLRLVAVAKGVEDAVSLGLLTGFGCDAFQGYYLSRPAAAAFITASLVDNGTALSRWLPA